MSTPPPPMIKTSPFMTYRNGAPEWQSRYRVFLKKTPDGWIANILVRDQGLDSGYKEFRYGEITAYSGQVRYGLTMGSPYAKFSTRWGAARSASRHCKRMYKDTKIKEVYDWEPA
jgi:hypothetical protein